MKSRDYDKIVTAISNYKGDDCGSHLRNTFPLVEAAQLSSLLAQEQQRRVKRSYHHYSQPSKMLRIYNKYTAAVERGEGPGILLEMACYYNFSSAMLAKLILEHFLSQHPLDTSLCASSCADNTNDRLSSPPSMSFTQDATLGNGERGKNNLQVDLEDGSERADSFQVNKSYCAASVEDPSGISPVAEVCQTAAPATAVGVKGIGDGNSQDLTNAINSRRDLSSTLVPVMSHKSRVNKMYRDTALIPDKVLSFEVHMCLIHDEVYGPFADTIKHSVGHEYEVLLCRKLEELDIGYQTEDDLRVQGCDKTPDIKLDVPIGVGGRVVNWIESKASFGDRDNHKTYLKDQFWSYWNRFGPGLVIYWFGFIDELDNLGEKGIFLMDTFPSDIVRLDPLAGLGGPSVSPAYLSSD